MIDFTLLFHSNYFRSSQGQSLAVTASTGTK